MHMPGAKHDGLFDMMLVLDLLKEKVRRDLEQRNIDPLAMESMREFVEHIRFFCATGDHTQIGGAADQLCVFMTKTENDDTSLIHKATQIMIDSFTAIKALHEGNLRLFERAIQSVIILYSQL